MYGTYSTVDYLCSAIVLRSHLVCRSKGERELLALRALSH